MQSAGILLYHFDDGHLKVFIVHPGGPFWKNKDLGTWSLPKGEFSEDELPLNAAIREFEEETGQKIAGDFIELHPVKLKSGKIIYAWALNGNVDAEKILSNEIEIDWPPRSGKKIMIPEVDKGEWFTTEIARQKIIPAQIPFIDELEKILPATYINNLAM